MPGPKTADQTKTCLAQNRVTEKHVWANTGGQQNDQDEGGIVSVGTRVSPSSDGSVKRALPIVPNE